MTHPKLLTMIAAVLVTVFFSRVTLAEAPPGPLTITKSFNPTEITVGNTSIITITVTNPNGTAVSNVSFNDTIPANLSFVTQTGGTCGTADGTGGGSTNLNVGAGTFSSTSSALASGASCFVTLSVRGKSPGLATNVTSPVSSTETGTNGTAQATLQVDPAPPVPATSLLWQALLFGSLMVSGLFFLRSRRV